MPDTAILDLPEEDTAPVPARTQRRVAARQALVRRALATTAGLGVIATVLAFVALSRPAPAKSPVHVPSAKAAFAAFTSGLAKAKPVAVAPAAVTAKRANAATSGAVAVRIKNYAFAPATLTI